MMPTLLIGALSAILPSLPPAEMPNTEVATNIPLVVDAARLQQLDFELSVLASPSNNFELAVGRDADSDGRLSLLEADRTFGYDAGQGFVADTELGVRAPLPCVTNDEGLAVVRYSFSKHAFNPRWNMIRLVRRGLGTQLECAVKSEDHVRFFIRIR